MKKLSRYSWIDPRIAVKESLIEGKGLFTTATIKKNEIVEVFGGILFTEREFLDGKMREHTGLTIAEGMYLGIPAGSGEISIDEFTNHSCDPSCWLVDEVTLVARRDLKIDEEITMDYATWEAEDRYVILPECHCFTKLCRKKITGEDWKNKELQQRYKGHFSPYIEKKIFGK